MVMFFRAPKGQLDANDKLFKLIASTIHPEPEWQKWSNGVIAALYRKKQRRWRSSRRSSRSFRCTWRTPSTASSPISRPAPTTRLSAQDQLIRGVQTFRDPSTGATFELSNQYDHAWLNGVE